MTEPFGNTDDNVPLPEEKNNIWNARNRHSAESGCSDSSHLNVPHLSTYEGARAARYSTGSLPMNLEGVSLDDAGSGDCPSPDTSTGGLNAANKDDDGSARQFSESLVDHATCAADALLYRPARIICQV